MEILLVRHAESYANKADFTAFGNEDSPLTEYGIVEARALQETLHLEYGLDGSEPCVASEYTRAQQTAAEAGFSPSTWSVLNESVLDPTIFDWTDANKPMDKHVKDGWIPLETLRRAAAFLEAAPMFDYKVYFTHGLFIAGVLTVCKIAGIDTFNYPFDKVRGYVPLRTQIVPIDIPTSVSTQAA